MIPPFRARFNPASQHINFFLAQRLFTFRHALVRIFMGDADDKLTVIRIARDDRSFATFHLRERITAKQ